MRILLDTHIALWAITDDERLPARARELLTGSSSDVHFSVASLWEIAIKASLGRLDFSPGTVGKSLVEGGFQRLSIEDAHLERLATLPHFHRDPFDRLLIAQAEAEPLRLVTIDRHLESYGHSVLIV